MSKCNYLAWAGLCGLIIMSVNAFVHAADKQFDGVASSGVPGVRRLSFPTSAPKRLFLRGTGGYGVFESTGETIGADHRLGGGLAVGYGFDEHVLASLGLSGQYDRHPNQDGASDQSVVFRPRLSVRGGIPIGARLTLGLDLSMMVPPEMGAAALAFDGTVLDLRALAAYRASAFPGLWGAYLGFRWDNSANAMPDLETTSEGDRLSLGGSEFNSILVGLAGSYWVGSFEMMGELSADFLLGNPESWTTSPMRSSLGLRYHHLENIQFELLTEIVFSARPGVGPEDPLIPIEPRFSALLGFTYVVDFTRTRAEAPAIEPRALEDARQPVVQPLPEPEETPVVLVSRFEGTLRLVDGEPVHGVVVLLRAGETTWETTTDENGLYLFENVPAGPVTLEIDSEEFERTTWDVQVGDGTPSLEPRELTPVAQPSVLRGTVFERGGEPIAAVVTVSPLELEATTDETGFFEIELPPGEYQLAIRAEGFKTQQKNIKIGENSAIILNIKMWRSAP